MNFLTRYSTSVFTSLSEHLEAFTKSAERNRVHKFRVDIKRIQALLFLVNSRDNNEAIKEPEFLDRIFNVSGRLRETQVERKSFQRQKPGEDPESLGWNELLKRTEQKSKRKLQKAAMKVDKEELEYFRRLLDRRLKAIDQRKARLALLLFYGSLQQMHQKEKLNRNNLHHLRKKLKHISYILEAMENTARPVAKVTAKAQMLIALNNLGKWHDAAVTLTHLEKLEDDFKSVFPNIVKKLKGECKRKCRKYYKKARETAADLLLQDLILT